MMSHELRSPLTALLGCADLLLTATGLGDDAQDLAALIKSSGGYLLNIVNDILDFSKITSTNSDFTLDTTEFDPAHLAKSAASMFLPQSMSKKVNLVVNFDHDSMPTGTMVRCDCVGWNRALRALCCVPTLGGKGCVAGAHSFLLLARAVVVVVLESSAFVVAIAGTMVACCWRDR